MNSINIFGDEPAVECGCITGLFLVVLVIMIVLAVFFALTGQGL